jgi:hypothetical protein
MVIKYFMRNPECTVSLNTELTQIEMVIPNPVEIFAGTSTILGFFLVFLSISKQMKG